MKKFQSKSAVLTMLLVVLTGFMLYGCGSERKSITSPRGATEQQAQIIQQSAAAVVLVTDLGTLPGASRRSKFVG